MSLVHYFFGEEGEGISKYIKSQNISADIVVERFTNKILQNCLDKGSVQAKEKVLRAYQNIDEDFNYRAYFDNSILLNISEYKTDDDVLLISYNETLGNESYALG